jgi:hypothetical protein
MSGLDHVHPEQGSSGSPKCVLELEMNLLQGHPTKLYHNNMNYPFMKDGNPFKEKITAIGS